MPFKEVLIVSATTTTVIQFLSGMFTAYKVWRLGTSGDLSPFPFLTAVVGCSLWLFYGITIDDSTIVYSNSVGVILNIFYVFVFMLYSSKRSGLVQQLVAALTFLAVVVLYLGAVDGQSEQKDSLGLLCVVVTLLCCASPLIALKLVIQSKSTEMLPFPLILSMFLVCSQWWVYGILIDDFYMQVTNFLGTLIALAQLSLFVIYRSGKKMKTLTTPSYAPLKSQS